MGGAIKKIYPGPVLQAELLSFVFLFTSAFKPLLQPKKKIKKKIIKKKKKNPRSISLFQEPRQTLPSAEPGGTGAAPSRGSVCAAARPKQGLGRAQRDPAGASPPHM